MSEPLVRQEDAQELLDALGDPDSDALRDAPEPVLRQVFDAFRLTVTYDARTGRALCRAVVSDDTLPAVQDALSGIQRGGRAAAMADDGSGPASDGPGRAHRGGLFVCSWRPRLSAMRTMTL